MVGNKQKLEKFLETSNESEAVESHCNRLLGLMGVWNEQTADAVGVVGKEYTKFFLTSDKALNIFFSFYGHIHKPYFNTDKDKFQYALLHAQWGLCVYIITLEETNGKRLVLRPDNVDMDTFLDFISQQREEQFIPRHQMDKWLVEIILNGTD